MLRRIEPKAVICYSDPFPEMAGNIITVDYAETNNLGEHKKFWTFYQDNGCLNAGVSPLPKIPQDADVHYVNKICGYIVTNGFGGGGRSRMGRIHGKTPRDHEKQNKEFEEVSRQLKLSKKQQEELHREIGKQGYDFKELLEIAREMFGIED